MNKVRLKKSCKCDYIVKLGRQIQWTDTTPLALHRHICACLSFRQHSSSIHNNHINFLLNKHNKSYSKQRKREKSILERGGAISFDCHVWQYHLTLNFTLFHKK